MDTRGLGWSSPAPDGDYRKARIAEDAVALLDDLAIERALLLGHDWGAWAGFIAVGAAPERWTGYVATGVPHPWQPPRALLRTLPRTLYQPPIAAPFVGPRIIPRLVPTFLRVGWGDKSTYDEAAEEIYTATYREPARAEAASRYYRHFLAREALRDAPRRPTVPTKLLYGTREPLGRAGAEGFPDVEFLEGCGHFVPEERPLEVAAAVRSIRLRVMVVKINAIEVAEGRGPELEERFAKRAGEVEGCPASSATNCCARPRARRRYFVYTRWETEEAFRAWVESPSFTRGHAQAAADSRGTVAHGAALMEFEVVQKVEPPAYGDDRALPAMSPRPVAPPEGGACWSRHCASTRHAACRCGSTGSP